MLIIYSRIRNEKTNLEVCLFHKIELTSNSTRTEMEEGLFLWCSGLNFKIMLFVPCINVAYSWRGKATYRLHLCGYG